MSTPSSKTIQDIINAEGVRLNEKEQSFNNLQFGKQRVLELNKNFQERTTAFNWIFTVFFSTLAFMILLFYLNTVIYGIDIFINIAAFAVGVLGLGYSIFLYISFRQRDPTDFDKIIYEPPGTISADQAASNASANYSNDDVPFRTSSDSTDTYDNSTTGNSTTGNLMIGNGIVNGNLMIGNGIVNGNLMIGNGIGSKTYGNIGANVISLNMPMNGNGYGDSSSDIYNTYNTNNYNTYGNGNNGETGIFGTGPIPTDPDKTIGTVTTTSTPVTSVNFNIPKLITNEIYLGDKGRDTILVIDQKTFYFFNLNIGKDIFKSLDNVFFTDINNSKFTATVVNSGPDSTGKVKINGKGIIITVNSEKVYYFYPSKYPASLLTYDEFLSPSGQTIEVISPNEFNLISVTNQNSINSNTKNILRTYQSTDGNFFIDSANNSNVAKVVIQAPSDSKLNQEAYGQAIHLSNDNTSENTYFYYNHNKNPIQNEIPISGDYPNTTTPGSNTSSVTEAPTPSYPVPTTTAAPTTTALPKKTSGLTWRSFLSRNEGYDHSSYSYGKNDYYLRILYHRSNIGEDPGNHTFQFDGYYTSGEQPHNNVSSNYAWNTLPSKRNDAVFNNYFVNNRLININFNSNIAYPGNRFGFNQTNNYSNDGRGIGMAITGFFLPSKTGQWTFNLAIPGVGVNDDISVFWISDDNSTGGKHWPPNDTNYNLKQTWEGGNTQYTTTLNANTYYPFQITWGQSIGKSILGLYFQGPDTNGWRSDGNGFFFSDP